MGIVTAETPTDRERFRGALIGLAVGDALGTSVEFMSPGSFAPITDIVGGGPFSLPAGAWTDDTSMALCLAESLVECEGFDPIDQLGRYLRWYRDGYLSSTGECFDIGAATSAALRRFEKTSEPFPGDAQPDAAGNGPLMKLAPIALAYARHPEQAAELAGLSARTTHGSAQARDACRYFCGLMVGALTGANVSQLLHQGVYKPAPTFWIDDPLHPEVADVAAGSFNAKEPPAITGGGYVIDALEAALWALMKTRNFEDGVLLAVNLGDDADTTAAIYGQIAGALYGVGCIPECWRRKLVMHDRIEELADSLLALSSHISSGVISRPAPTNEKPANGPNDSYWVSPGDLLAGPYPGDAAKATAEEKLGRYLDAGITCFIDLTEEGEGPPLKPYSQLLRKIASQRGVRVSHLRLPIRDVAIPLCWEMQVTLRAIRKAVENGETVYVHCWGGVGRTGTVIGCLMKEAGAPAEEVLDQLAWLRSMTKHSLKVSPETEEQRTFVLEWRSEEDLSTRSARDRAGGRLRSSWW